MKNNLMLLLTVLFGGALASTFAAAAPVATPAPYNPKFMERAIAVAKTVDTTPDTDPFGAVIVQNGKIVGEGLSAMRKNGDPARRTKISASWISPIARSTPPANPARCAWR